MDNKAPNFDSKDLALDDALAVALNIPRSKNILRVLEHNLDFVPELKLALQALNKQISSKMPDDSESCKKWWKANCKTLRKQLRSATVKYRNIGHDWQFSNEQKDQLQQYFDANLLLIDCLNSGCCVSRDVRQEIEDTLLLPMSETVRDRTQQT